MFNILLRWFLQCPTLSLILFIQFQNHPLFLGVVFLMDGSISLLRILTVLYNPVQVIHSDPFILFFLSSAQIRTLGLHVLPLYVSHNIVYTSLLGIVPTTIPPPEISNASVIVSLSDHCTLKTNGTKAIKQILIQFF